jgi:hypothetical protein
MVRRNGKGRGGRVGCRRRRRRRRRGHNRRQILLEEGNGCGSGRRVRSRDESIRRDVNNPLSD